jgi:hypothetical protein
MLLTSDQTSYASEWAKAEVSSSVAEGPIVIVGIGSVAPYVESTLRLVNQYAPHAESVWIVSPIIGDNWTAIIGESSRTHMVHMTAEEFFDSLLRCCIRRRIKDAASLAKELDDSYMSDRSVALHWHSAVKSLTDDISTYRVESLCLYLRKTTASQSITHDAATGDTCVKILLGLSLVKAALGATVDMIEIGNDVYLELNSVLVEPAIAPTAITGARLSEQVRQRLRAAKRRGLLPGHTKYILMLATGHVGPLPTGPAPEDLVDTPEAEDIIDGPDYVRDRWLDLGAVLTASDALTVRELLSRTFAIW